MNALKAFMMVICFLFSAIASAVTVSIVPGKEVGVYNNSAFWGLITVNVDGRDMLAMVNHFEYEILTPWWYTDNTSWETNLYSQDDILNGAVVSYSPDRYSKAAPIFLQGLLGYNPPDPLWAAGHNEMIWNIFPPDGASPVWISADATFIGMYNNTLPTLDPNFNYRGFMMVLSSPGASYQEMLVYAPAVPIPPAFWLFGSGLLGLVAVARKKVVRV